MDEARMLHEFLANQAELRREAYERWRVERYHRFMPAPDPVVERYPTPSHWDEGQLAENELPTWSDWKAIDAARDLMRSYFPRMTPPPCTNRIIDRVLAPSPAGRRLQAINFDDVVNYQACDHALSVLQPARMLTEAAVFVGRDANYALMTARHADNQYLLAFFDPGVASPWLTRRYEDIGYGIDAVTGRQMYIFSHD
jgi:hypothetical protein